MSWNSPKAMQVLGSLLLAAHAAPAQEATPQTESPEIKVEVRQVLVPVVVTDGKGHHVTGLKASDFKVYEEGVEQQIVSFGTELAEAPFLPSAAPEEAEPLLTAESPQPGEKSVPPVRRTYLVALDTLFMTFASTHRVHKSLEKIFKQEESPDSNYALVALDRRLRIVRSATRSSDNVLAAIRSKQMAAAFTGAEGLRQSQQESQLISMLEDYCQGGRCFNIKAGEPSDQDPALDQIEHFAASVALERSVLTRTFLHNLADIIAKMSEQPGKRILILVSDGFDLWPGRTLYALIAAYIGRPNFIMRNPAERLGPEMEKVVRAATAGDVVVYPVDSRGLPAPTFGVFDATRQRGIFAGAGAGQITSEFITQMSFVEHARQDTMARLADVTGGVFFHGNNDLAKGMRQAFADGREYYVLAYVPRNRAEDGKFRKIRVEVRNKRANVRAKDGYWAPGPAPTQTASSETYPSQD